MLPFHVIFLLLMPLHGPHPYSRPTSGQFRMHDAGVCMGLNGGRVVFTALCLFSCSWRPPLTLASLWWVQLTTRLWAYSLAPVGKYWNTPSSSSLRVSTVNHTELKVRHGGNLNSVSSFCLRIQILKSRQLLGGFFVFWFFFFAFVLFVWVFCLFCFLIAIYNLAKNGIEFLYLLPRMLRSTKTSEF